MYLLNGSIHGEFICFLLCFTEDNGSAVAAAVHLDDIGEHGCTLAPVACDGQMLPWKRQKQVQRERKEGKKEGKSRNIFSNSAD